MNSNIEITADTNPDAGPEVSETAPPIAEVIVEAPKPKRTTRAAKPVKSVKSSKPVKAARALKADKVEEIAAPAGKKSDKPAKPAKPAKTAKIIQPARPVKRVKAAKAVAVARVSRATKPGQSAKSAAAAIAKTPAKTATNGRGKRVLYTSNELNSAAKKAGLTVEFTPIATKPAAIGRGPAKEFKIDVLVAHLRGSNGDLIRDRGPGTPDYNDSESLAAVAIFEKFRGRTIHKKLKVEIY